MSRSHDIFLVLWHKRFFFELLLSRKMNDNRTFINDNMMQINSNELLSFTSTKNVPN